MNIVIIGPPGSGKGTQGRFLIKNHNYQGIITGEILRKMSGDGTDLGNQIKDIIDAGNLVPDEMIDSMMTDHLGAIEVNGAGLIFDGYPRTVTQAQTLDGLITVDKAIYLNVEEEELVKRILKRGKISGREDDQNEDIIRNRMETYRTDTAPVLEHYRDQEKLVEIDGTKSIKDIYSEILTALGS
jgi:adenylate kinase